MVIFTQRRGQDPYSNRTRRIARVDEPIEAASSGWGHNVGHYLEIGPYVGNGAAGAIEYTIRLTQVDIDKINRLWNDRAEHRAELDTELERK